jgi:hypothetical protein
VSGRSTVRRCCWQRSRWLGRWCEREPAVDDGIAFFALAVLLDHAVHVCHPKVGAAQVSGRREIDRIDDGQLILQMSLSSIGILSMKCACGLETVINSSSSIPPNARMGVPSRPG